MSERFPMIKFFKVDIGKVPNYDPEVDTDYVPVTFPFLAVYTNGSKAMELPDVPGTVEDFFTTMTED